MMSTKTGRRNRQICHTASQSASCHHLQCVT